MRNDKLCPLCQKARILTKHHILDSKTAIKLADTLISTYHLSMPLSKLQNFLKKRAGCIPICRSCHDKINILYDEMNSPTDTTYIKESSILQPQKHKRYSLSKKLKSDKRKAEHRQKIILRAERKWKGYWKEKDVRYTREYY